MTTRRSLSLLTFTAVLASLASCGSEEPALDNPPVTGGTAGQGTSGKGGASTAGTSAGGNAQAGSSPAGAGQSGGSAAGASQGGAGGSAAGNTSGGQGGSSGSTPSGGQAGQSGGAAGEGPGGQGGATSEGGQGGATSEGGQGGAPAGGSGGASGGQSGAAGQGGGPGSKKANIIFILADDFSWNLVEHMKNLKQMQADGVTFSNYFVTDSLCCPSRSSIFTGKMPHNTGVFANVGQDGGYDTYLAKNNDDGTFAVTLKAAGYKTAMGGKFMNGYQVKSPNQPTGAKPKGWTDIFLASNGYPNFDYDLRQDGNAIMPNGPDLVHYGMADSDYLTDVMLKLGKKFINNAKSDPFMVEIATFAPHAPYTAAPRHEGLFPNLKAPQPDNFNKKPTNAPPWLANRPSLTPDDITDVNMIFRKRVRAVQAIDEMIGSLREMIASDPKLAGNTYLMFSSDNGFHLGEHALKSGKMTAYSSDIQVPLIVVGPGVPAGTTVKEVTQNIDLCPTFADLGQTNAPTTSDGHSLVPLMLGQSVPNWRDAGLVEHHHADPDPTDPDPSDPTDPPDYAALRTKDRLFVRYTASGNLEFYELDKDPYELKNVAGSLSDQQQKHWTDWLKQARACKGAQECWAALHEPQ